MIYFAFLTIFVLSTAHITYLDLKQDYINVNYAQKYSLSFALSYPITSLNFIKVIFPIQLDSTSSFSAVWTNDVISAYPTIFPAIISRSKIPSEASIYSYFIQVLTSASLPTSLSAYTSYKLILTSSTPYGGSTGWSQSLVQIYTTTSDLPSHIIIDSNPSFAPLFFTTSPATSTSLTSSLTSGSQNCGTLQQYTVQFTPAASISSNYLIALYVSNSEFSIKSCGSCIIVNGEHIEYQIASNLPSGTPVSFTLNVEAPYAPQTTSITLYSVAQFYSNIQEVATLNNAFSSLAITWPAVNYISKFTWGLDASDATLPTCIRMYRNGPTQNNYNRIQILFTPGSALPNVEYQVKLDLTGSYGILENSIVHNLPGFGGATVICRATSTAVSCSNVASLTVGNQYYISTSASLLNTLTSLGGTFGQISMFGYLSNSNTYALNSIITPKTGSFASGLLTNLDRQYNNETPIWGWPSSSSSAASGGGIKFGSISTFEFHANTQLADFAFTSNTGGIEIFTNGVVLPISNPTTCQSNYFGFLTSDVVVCDSSIQTFQGLSAARFRISFGTKNSNAFSNYMPFRASYSTPLTINGGSYVADDQVIDVFFSAVSTGLNNPTTYATPNQCYMMNGYIISQPTSWPIGNVNVFISNMWTSASVNYLTGSQFPAFIQINGQWSSSDYNANTQKILLFFTYLQPFENQNYATTNQISCSGTNSVRCYYYPGVSSDSNYFHNSRIEILTTFTTSPFQILIPVATEVNQLIISTTLGLAQSYGSLPANPSLGLPQNAITFNFNFGSLGALGTDIMLVNNNYIDDENYFLVTSGKLVGSVGTANIEANHVDATGSTFAPNTGTFHSALYSWTTKYNFFTLGSTASATFVGSQSCLFYQYYYPSDLVYSNRYGVACPVNSNLAMPLTPAPNIQLNNFQFPNIEGCNMPESYSALSTNQGVLLVFARDIRTNVFIPNIIPNVEFSPVLYESERADIAQVTFTTTNILPQFSYVQMVASTNFSWQFSLKKGSFCAVFQNSIPNLQTTSTLPNNCVQNSEGSTITFQINATTAWTSNKIIIVIYELNVTTRIITSSQLYTLSTYNQEMSLIDSTTSSSSVTPVNYLTQTRSSDLTINSIRFLSDTANTKTQIILSITTSSFKPMTRFDQLAIDFWESGSLDDTFACEAYDIGETTSLYLSGCKVNPPFVALTSYYDLLTPKTFTVRLKSFQNPLQSSIVSLKMLDYEDALVLSAQTEYSYPPNIEETTEFAEFYMNKYFNTMFMAPEFIFTFRFTIPFNTTSAIIIRLPSLYGFTDTYSPLLCIIDSLETNCVITNPQEITIMDPPVNFEAQRLFRLSVFGLRQPQIPSAYDICFILASKENTTRPIYYQQMPDIIPSTTGISNLQVSWLTLSTDYLLSTAIMNIEFSVGLGSLSSRTLIIDFPMRFGQALHNQTFGYSFSQGGGTLASGTVKMKLFRFQLQLTGITLAATTTYTLIMTGIPTPFTQVQSPIIDTIGITESDQSTIQFQSNRGLMNFWLLTNFVYNPSLWSIGFSQLTNNINIPQSYSSPFNVIAGIPSQNFEINVENPLYRFDRFITLTPESSNYIKFNSTPSIINATCGLWYYSFSLNIPQTISPGYYSIQFYLSEIDPATDSPSSNYALSPPLIIHLNAEQYVIQVPVFPSNTLSLPVGGFTFPIIFDLSQAMPPNGLTIMAYIPPSSNMELNFEDLSQIELDSKNFVAQFNVVYVGGGVPGITQTTVSFYLSGPDQSLYSISSQPITIQLLSAPSFPPNLTCTGPTSITQTTFTLQVIVDQISQVYYQIIGAYGLQSQNWEMDDQNGVNSNLAFTKSMVNLRNAYSNNEFEREDQFFGVWGYMIPNLAQSYTLTGLRSGISYTIYVWAVNLVGMVSTPFRTTASTLTNGGHQAAIKITVDSILQNRQINKINCFMAVRYQLPFDILTDFLGFGCNGDRQGSHGSFDAISSSQYTMIQNPIAGNYEYIFYAYPFSFSATDNTAAVINSDVISNNLVTSLSNFVGTWPFTAISIINAQFVTFTDLPVYFVDLSNNPTTNFEISITNTTITFYNMKLNQNGFIWIYALRKFYGTSSLSEFFLPEKDQFKYYINKRLYDENYISLKYYSGTPITSVFNGLKPNTEYFFYWFAQNNDPLNQNLTSFTYSQFYQTLTSWRISSKAIFIIIVLSYLLIC